ncbi:probable serine/threonine-protein kinase PBL21 [Hibiscus syriacus]|uniref:probable serine/threonine-protein kinase PBL21 n=1 Tax=Hibiscus syriacus TaxID=106335 RepID=UPI0019233267|nr:probable serine/threonine-protein kinase PBL21 [Hibiscus syriacus]
MTMIFLSVSYNIRAYNLFMCISLGEGRSISSRTYLAECLGFSFLAVKPKTTDAVTQVGSLPRLSSTRFLQYEELKEATNNFAPASTLGEGGFGRVFKCVLTYGTAVAIKRLISGGPQGNKEFLVEVGMLSILHHRNLMKLVGYYSNRDSSQNLLCYELVPNRSLEAWLQGNLSL